MLRKLVLALATLALPLSLHGAETISIDVNCGNFTNKQPAPHADSAAAASSGEDAAAEIELLEAANKNRQAAGVPPLRMEDTIRVAARAHAQRMVQAGQLEHQFSGEPALLERIAQTSPLKMDRAGENIANANCAPRANEVLMHSSPHRQNLLDRGFNVAGIAAIWSNGRLYVVQDFAHEVPSYSAQQTGKLVGEAIDDARQQAGLTALAHLTPPKLDQAACSLAENSSGARLLATAYENRKVVTYTQSRPEVLPQGALRLLRDPGVRQVAVGSCYARSVAYPTGTYFVAILLY
jgi:uncharacterized protein YkwD